MKFFAAMLLYILFGAGLCVGILYTAKGNPWLLIAIMAVYFVMIARIGCLSKPTHH